MIEIHPLMLLIQAANFLFMLWFLNTFVFKPVLKVVEEREAKFKGLEKEGKELIDRGERALADYEKKLAQLRHDSAEVTAKARKEALEAAAGIIDGAKDSFRQSVEKARSEISRDADAAGAALKKDIALFAGLISSRIMGRDAK